jgi:hypothetical protein
MDWQLLCVIDRGDFINIDCNEGGNNKCCFGNLQQYNVQDLYHPLPWCVRPMFFGNTFDLQKLK